MTKSKKPPCNKYEPPKHMLYRKKGKSYCKKETIKNNPSLPILSVNDKELIKTKRLNKLFGKRIKRVGVHDEGTCFFHSFLYIHSDEYRNMNKNQRGKYGRKFRKEMGKELNKNFNKLEFSDFGYDKSELKEFIEDPSEWVGNETWKLVSHVFDVNIIIFRSEEDMIYCGQENFNKKKPYYLFLNVGDIHYEPIVNVNIHDETIKTQFNDKDKLIKKIKDFYGKRC